MEYKQIPPTHLKIYPESGDPQESSNTCGVYYWSTHPGSGRVYHKFRNCDVGNNIEREYLVFGYSPPAGYRGCERCEVLERSGYGEPGVPIPVS